MSDECVHEWHCPGTVNVPSADGGILVLLPLYCRLCAAATTRLAPPPEPDAQARARSQIAIPQLVPTGRNQRR